MLESERLPERDEPERLPERLPERDERAFALGPADRLIDVAMKTLGRHLRRMIWNEPGTRLGVEPDYLHDMRVATRRLRTALEVFAEAIPEGTREDFARELRWVGRALGRVRDLDVGLLRVAAMAAETSKEERTALDIFARDLELRRARRRVRLLERLDSERYADFVERALAWLAAGPQAADAPASALAPAYHAGPRIVAEWDRRMRETYEDAHADPSTAHAHALRIAAKRARYAVEYFAELTGPSARDRAKRLARLQDFLGARQDAATLLRRMRRYAKTIPQRDHELTLGAGAALGQLERAARTRRADLHDAWGELES